MKQFALIAGLMLAACQPEGDSAPEVGSTAATANARSAESSPAPATSPSDSPTPAASASSLTADFCDEHGDDPDSPYGNRKSCYMQACEAGDKASCDLMGSYNGNLEQPAPAQ